jgi:hypothetical protein
MPENGISGSRASSIQEGCSPEDPKSPVIQNATTGNNRTVKFSASAEDVSQNERGLKEVKSDRVPHAPDCAAHRHSNTLLRIMQQRPSKIPGVLQNSPSGRPEWSQNSHSRPASKFHKMEAQSVFWKVVNGYRKQKDRYEVISGVNRRAYLFMPQLHQDPRNTSVTYKVTEIELSQSEIAYALSYWAACKSGARHFNSWEPSQKQALDQIETERGKLFPAQFIIDSIQYTNPRIFSTTAALLKSHDILVVVEELRLQPGQERQARLVGMRQQRMKMSYPVLHSKLSFQAEGSSSRRLNWVEGHRTIVDTDNSAEDYVDRMIREFGVPLSHGVP